MEGARDASAGLPGAHRVPAAPRRTARRALALDGYTRYEQSTGVTPAELLRIHGVGPKAIRIQGEELAERGPAFAG